MRDIFLLLLVTVSLPSSQVGLDSFLVGSLQYVEPDCYQGATSCVRLLLLRVSRVSPGRLGWGFYTWSRVQ